MVRVVYAAVFTVAIVELAGAAALVSDGDSGVGQASQVLARIAAFQETWSAGLLLFGVHLLLLGALMLRATYVSTVLGVLLLIAGAGYAVDGFGEVLFAGYDANVAAFTFVGEVVLIFWLLLRGRRIDLEAVESRPAG